MDYRIPVGRPCIELNWKELEHLGKQTVIEV